MDWQDLKLCIVGAIHEFMDCGVWSYLEAPRTTITPRLFIDGNQWCALYGDMTAEEYRGYCKLHFGVPMLRAESDEFAAKYDQYVRPLPYETKMALMMEPFDFPVTRLMDTAQKGRYLDQIYVYLTGLGFKLTEPKKSTNRRKQK